jgi:hypothetical protein
LIKGEAKIKILEGPVQSFLSTYGLSSVFNSSFDFIDSSIFTTNERISLKKMLNIPTEGKLIYRASRDGFSASSFHSKCDGISNTVTIIKTTSNSVFGGFASESWSPNFEYKYDANAFIFSLRREGSQNNQRLNITQPQRAILSLNRNGPWFGEDINVSDNSNQNNVSNSNLGDCYQLPDNITYYSQEARSYLAGSFNWKTTEIEVYQVSPFEPFSVSFLHNGCLLFKVYIFYLNFNLIQ